MGYYIFLFLCTRHGRRNRSGRPGGCRNNILTNTYSGEQLILRKISNIDAISYMSHFKAKMHQIQFLLGLRPEKSGGTYSASPEPLAVFKGACFEGEGDWKRGKGKGEREEVEGKEEGREEEGKGREVRWGKGFAGPMTDCFLRACPGTRISLKQHSRQYGSPNHCCK